MKIWGVILLLLLVAGPSWGLEIKGLATPESFIIDSNSEAYYISNIGGSPVARDNNGFITKLNSNGEVTGKEFIKGGVDGVQLHAPKGLAIIGKVLYVTDIDHVYGFNKETGKLIHAIDLAAEGAKFLNDLVATDDGILYVSDTAVFVDPNAPPTIFKIETANGYAVSVYSKDPMLSYPNGLIINPETNILLVNTWGEGRILEVHEGGKATVFAVHNSWKNLDGMDYDSSGNLYVSSFTGGNIFRIAKDRSVTEILSGLPAPADISVDRAANQLLIPLFGGHVAKIVSISP